MNVKTFPLSYGSMFRPACFELESVQSPGGVDVEIRAIEGSGVLGVKRIYASGAASVNVAPYARRLLSPAPLCGLGSGIHTGAGRSVACYITAPGLSSRTVVLCGGSEHSPSNTLLSASPSTVTISPGERDEVPVISGDWILPVVTFRRGNTSYTHSLGQRIAEGIVAAVVDVDALGAAYSRLTGASSDELDRFTVRLNLDQAGYTDRIVERTYVVDRARHTGRRLAWLNRFGAVDYYTFPVADEFRSSGGRTRIETSWGFRTVATSSVQSLRLVSGACDESQAEWLSELFSSPAVWIVQGGDFEKVEVAEGDVSCSPLRPTFVSVVVSPAVSAASRKL